MNKKRINRSSLVAFALSILLIQVTFISAQSARDIVDKSHELVYAKSSYSEFSMTIIKPDWSRTLTMKAWSLEPDYSLIYVLSPARDKGTVTLKREKEVWNWIPAAQKVIKIPPSMMLQSWMGSDFTNDDLVRSSSVVDDYEHKILASEKIDSYECYKIESIPKPEAGVVWGKIITWITKTGFMQLKSEFYDEDGFIIKTFRGSDIKTLGGRTFPAKWEMIPQDKPGNKTVIEYHQIKFNFKIDESFFSQQNMKRVR
ncbi:MAG: outer membrane lipoprotein-sorting protein [Bacteroidetes bacterium]|nr:outer membrane lipoprotein-sorting protein [Bacteroidota bacterium]